jgi:hypothetical protein
VLCAGGARADDPQPASEDAVWEACSAAYERAQVERHQGRLRAARASLVACLAPACPATARSDCGKWLGEVEASLPTVVLDARDAGRQLADVRVTIDGAELARRLDGVGQPVDPGTHRFRFEAPGRPPIERQLTVLEGERNRRIVVEWNPVSAARPEQSASRASVVGPLVLGGIGVVALGSFGYFGLTSIDRENDLEESCAPTRTCPAEDLDAVYARRAVADVSLGVGLVAIGVATVWLVSELSRGSPPATARAPRPLWRF